MLLLNGNIFCNKTFNMCEYYIFLTLTLSLTFNMYDYYISLTLSLTLTLI